MQGKFISRAALAIPCVGGCVGLGGICASAGDARGVEIAPLTMAQANIPQQPEVSVSPATPGTLSGTTAGPDTSVGTNPITGQSCIGGGSLAVNGGIIGAPTAAGQPAEPGTNTAGLPPNNSVYGLNNGTNTGPY
jgi:hypothetical protein